jgi:hypothetical protein
MKRPRQPNTNTNINHINIIGRMTKKTRTRSTTHGMLPLAETIAIIRSFIQETSLTTKNSTTLQAINQSDMLQLLTEIQFFYSDDHFAYHLYLNGFHLGFLKHLSNLLVKPNITASNVQLMANFRQHLKEIRQKYSEKMSQKGGSQAQVVLLSDNTQVLVSLLVTVCLIVGSVYVLCQTFSIQWSDVVTPMVDQLTDSGLVSQQAEMVLKLWSEKVQVQIFTPEDGIQLMDKEGTTHTCSLAHILEKRPLVQRILKINQQSDIVLRDCGNPVHYSNLTQESKTSLQTKLRMKEGMPMLDILTNKKSTSPVSSLLQHVSIQTLALVSWTFASCMYKAIRKCVARVVTRPLKKTKLNGTLLEDLQSKVINNLIKLWNKKVLCNLDDPKCQVWMMEPENVGKISLKYIFVRLPKDVTQTSLPLEWDQVIHDQLKLPNGEEIVAILYEARKETINNTPRTSLPSHIKEGNTPRTSLPSHIKEGLVKYLTDKTDKKKTNLTNTTLKLITKS